MLLAHLARFGSFSGQSELLCTQGLLYVLQTHGDARSAMARIIEERTGVAIDSAHTWHGEARQEDLGRPDLEARTTEGVPVVKIEAKLGAAVVEKQLHSYIDDLQSRNDSNSVMLLLVPAARTEEATDKLASAVDQSGSGARPAAEAGRPTIGVIAWEELFEALCRESTGLLRYELEQLQAMYRVLTNGFIAPLADEAELRLWRHRWDEFVFVIDQVTRRLTTE